MRDDPFGEITITTDLAGENRYRKVSYPVRYGTYHQIGYGPYVFQFNLNGEIKHIQCRKGGAMEPTEWLKRTVGNDWVYYASGGYNGAFAAVGEYYIPCFRYASNGIMGGKPFRHGVLEAAETALTEVRAILERMPDQTAIPGFKSFRDRVLGAAPRALQAKAAQLHALLGGRISVLPPDARHVDYDVIPLNVSRGCLYNCGFCTVKTGRGFSRVSPRDIDDQITGLKALYGNDLVNYNALFLGQHDALNAGEDALCKTALTAFDAFSFDRSHMKEPRLFLFGSVGSLLQATDRLFEAMDRLPFASFINIGLESADPETLDVIGKPIGRQDIADAFTRMADINRSCRNLEITANFLYGDTLPDGHMPACLDLIQNTYPKPYARGAVYFSPYGTSGDNRSRVVNFKIVKNRCHLPVFLYIIQRL